MDPRCLSRSTIEQTQEAQFGQDPHSHALLIAFAIKVASSLIISIILQDAGLPLAQINHSGFWTCIHSASAYAICMLTIMHLAVHWAMIF